MFVRSRSRGGEGGTAAPDLQFYVGRGLDQPDRFVTITASLVRPTSRGEVRLVSADPLAAPRIRGNYLSDRVDLLALIDGVRIARELARSASYAKLRGDEAEPGASVTSDAALIEFAGRATDTIYHPAGTCRMGNDSRAVVDARLRVRGIEGLRVADASIMPDVVGATTHAACVMIGARAAEFIRQG
jgi:choline dehydrogenase